MQHVSYIGIPSRANGINLYNIFEKNYEWFLYATKHIINMYI